MHHENLLFYGGYEFSRRNVKVEKEISIYFFCIQTYASLFWISLHFLSFYTILFYTYQKQ